mgnify:FL=1
MKRNYLVKTYWERLYFEEYSNDMDSLILEYFQFKLFNGNQSETLSYSKQYKSLERFLYSLNVYRETNKNVSEVKNIDTRGHRNHLDHIIPISKGFNMGIDYKIIGGKDNLQVISSSDNIRKSNHPTAKGDYLLWKHKPEFNPPIKQHKFEKEGRSVYYVYSFNGFTKRMTKPEDDGFISIINLNTAEKIKDIKYR